MSINILFFTITAVYLKSHVSTRFCHLRLRGSICDYLKQFYLFLWPEDCEVFHTNVHMQVTANEDATKYK
jgi:hypothetical protein